MNDLISRQPKRTEERTETHSCDCISRKAAIEAVGGMLRRKFGIGGDLAEITLADLPSAQPELVRCKDCKFYRCDGCFFSTAETEENGFCSWAERRTDESD